MTSPQTPQGSIAGSVLPIRRAEELIATLPGVLSVRIVPNDTGAIDEIHVLTTNALLPKQTVRNIESALIAQLGLRVNHKKISIAISLDPPRAADVPFAGPRSSTVAGQQPAGTGGVSSNTSFAPAASSVAADAAPEKAAQSAANVGRRVLIFDDIEVRRSRTRGVLCKVTLEKDGVQFVGESEGQESERSRIDLAAKATLQAIVEAMKTSSGGERTLSLEGSKLIEAFDREFIFVSIAARVGRDMVVLTGSCEIRESAETSAVLAVLDATNRWMHLDR